MKRTHLILALSFLAAAWGTAPAQAATTCDIPLVIRANAVAPNVLIVLDTSGSMRSAITHPDYDAYATYDGPFTANRNYYVSETGTFTPRDFYYSFPSSPSAFLVESQLGTSGRYRGNYLNWVFFHATPGQRDNLPQTTRIEAGKAAIAAVLSRIPEFRYGLMTFDGNDGGKLVADVGTQLDDLFPLLADAPASGYTPTAETLIDALEYFRGSQSPIVQACQKTFIILVTDGYPTKDLDIPSFIGDQDGDGNEPGNCDSIGAPAHNSSNCSDWMDDVAYYLAHNDMASDLDGDQVVNTYTIGFGIDAPLLQDTADNGGGLYLTAWDAESLEQGLTTVLTDIQASLASNSSVAVVSAEEAAGDKVFRASFMAQTWAGHLEAYSLPVEEGDAPVWDAADLLANRSPDSREIVTWHQGSQIDFDRSNASDLMGELGAVSENAAGRLIDYIRGEHFEGMRDRMGSRLGDIVSATPRVVGAPRSFYLDPDYQDFLATHAHRAPMIYVGANDGMLHAFDEHGNEVWAYVPAGVLGHLSDLADPNYCHRAYVDLTANIYDVFLSGAWRTVLFGGLGNGGDSYFAIDITNPGPPRVLWETSVPEIFRSWTEPVLVNTLAGTFIWTGSGPDTAGTAWASVIDIVTGDVASVGRLGDPVTETNRASQAAPFDADYDGFVDFVYQTDLAGRLWRWDVRSGLPRDWTATLVYQGDQPIQSSPSLTVAPNGDALIYFGTGRYLEASDVYDTQTQRFVAIRDNGFAEDVRDNELKDQSSQINNVAGAAGWYINLRKAAGERVIEPSVLVDGYIYFTSFAPAQGGCDSGGTSHLYTLNYLNGSGPDPDPGATPTVDGRAVAVDGGIASRPVVGLDDARVIVQTSEARVSTRDLVTVPRRVEVTGWRQTFK